MDEHKIANETEVERTTPQGTQAHGVDHGHEDRDLNVPALVKWIVGLFAFAAFTHLLIAGMFFGLRYLTTDRAAQAVPWAMMDHPVPGPRLLPNPDQPSPQVPAASMVETRGREDINLKAYGLANDAGEPQVPDRAVAMIDREQGPMTVAPGLDAEGLPSSASGGRRADASK